MDIPAQVHHKKSVIEGATTWIGSIQSLVVHTLIFIVTFLVGVFQLLTWELVLLVLTTVVSLEAIYLAIFIQMTVNRHDESLRDVKEDIGELGEDVEDIQDDIGELGENVVEIQENVGELGEDVGDIQENIGELGENVEDIQENVEDLTDEDPNREQVCQQQATLENLIADLKHVLAQVEDFKSHSNGNGGHVANGGK